MKINKKLILIPGFRKSGTTTIFDYLESQNIGDTPKIKEPQLLASQAWNKGKQYETYKALYDDFDQSECIIDASTFLINDVERIRELVNSFDQVKIVICIRDPIKRFFSAFWHHKSKLDNIEFRELSEVIEQLEKSSYTGEIVIDDINNKYCDSDYYGRNYLRNKHNLDIDYLCKDPYFPFKYYEEGRYSLYLQKLDSLGIDYHLVLFEDLIQSPSKVLPLLSEYLECSFSNFTLEGISNSNKGYDRRTSKLLNIVKIESLWNLFPQNVKDKVKGLVFKPLPEPDVDHIARIRQLYHEELIYWDNVDSSISTKWKLAYEQ